MDCIHFRKVVFTAKRLQKIEENKNKIGSLRSQQKWEGRSWLLLGRVRLQVANQQDEKTFSTPTQLVAWSADHTGFGDLSFGPE